MISLPVMLRQTKWTIAITISIITIIINSIFTTIVTSTSTISVFIMTSNRLISSTTCIHWGADRITTNITITDNLVQLLAVK